jgi:hypothetical protein
VLAIVSAAGIALLAIYMSFSDIVTYRVGMLSVSVMTVIIIIFLRTLNEKAPVNEPRIISFLGTASYSVYLLHWPLYIIVTQLVREHGYRLSLSDRQAVACLASLLCTLPMAWLTYKYVESIPRGTRRLKRVALTIGAFMFVPSFYAVASAPKITSIEESFNYTPEEEVMPVFVVSAAENETPPPTSTDEPPRVEPTPAIQPPSDTPETQPPFITTEPEEEPTETKEPTAEPTAGQTAEPTTEPTAEPTEPIETAEQTAEPIVYPTDTPATEPDTETPAPESSTAPPLTQVAVNSSQMIGMPVPTATPVPTPAPIPVKPINSEFIDVKYEGLTLDGGVLILGDSVTLGASQVLYPLFNYVTDNNWTFEAKVSRNMKNGVTIINEYIADGRLINYKYIVLALASNIQNTTYDAIDELIQILGGDYKVIFVTGYGRDFMTEPAAYLRSLPGLYKNISVADWEKSIEGHTKELAPDGLHAGTTLSRKIYSECILDAILKTMEEREEEPPVAEPIEERKVIAP